MKKLFYILPFVVLLAAAAGFYWINGDPNADVSSSRLSESSEVQTDTIRPAGFPYPTQWNYNYASVPNLNAGTVGAMLLFGNYYFNRWNGTDTYILPNTGPNGGPSVTGMRTVPYTGSVRDLTTDGRYLYGGKASTILYKMDTNMALITQFSMTGNIRAITYDPNRVGFWYCDFAGNITCRDTANVLKHTITTTLAAKYGLGWDSTTHGGTDSAFVYVWDQGTGTTVNLQKFYVTPASPVMASSWIFTLTGLSIGIPGGAEIITDNYSNPPRKMLLLNYQNFALVGYKIGDVLTALNNQNEAVRNFALNQNYPNPFNPVTNITYTLTHAGDINLEVFNSLGEKVKTIYRGFSQAGDHRIVFDASEFSSGVYFYTLTAGDFSVTKKMLLVK